MMHYFDLIRYYSRWGENVYATMGAIIRGNSLNTCTMEAAYRDTKSRLIDENPRKHQLICPTA